LLSGLSASNCSVILERFTAITKMSVHYKFKNSADQHTVTFDGVHISVSDLKKAIIEQKKVGKSPDCDLQIQDAETKKGIS